MDLNRRAGFSDWQKTIAGNIMTIKSSKLFMPMSVL
jgi:hypothetical protein